MYRPVYHYAPEFGWMNDPNGLYYLNGTYHLFYQYNPTDTQFGNMSWGHATSPDLVNWTEQEVALLYSEQEWIFSGSVVVDHDNTSGFGYGANGEPPVVAIYTSNILPQNGQPYDQEQSIAYSLDNGQTWTRYDGNPVLDIENPEFRDPKVFWQDNPGDDDYWVMSLVRATEFSTDFYKSYDLKSWDYMSSFGPANAVGGIWEVPDLIKMTVENTGETKWLLIQNINPGGIQGGSATQYFIGDWDGTTFIADNVRLPVPEGSIVLEDFETGYDGWTVTGGAFGAGPAAGAFAGQLAVSGYDGTYLVNSFLNNDGSVGDGGTGRMISDPFVITEGFINLKVGGGAHAWDLSLTGDFGAPGGQVIASFDFGVLPEGWVGTGDFASIRPSAGGNADFQDVSNFDGEGLINTFNNPEGSFDAATGTIESPEFTITRDFINLKVGGGQWDGVNFAEPATRVELVVEGTVVHFASGQNTNALRDVSWDVSAYKGQTAQIRIVDQNTGAWGQILVDSIEQNDISVFHAPADPVVFEDWEAGPELPLNWTVTGDFANGLGTAEGLVIDGRTVSGYEGNRLLSTFWVEDPESGLVGDVATGTITSDPFVITDTWINALVGGGGHVGAAETSIKLLVDGEVVRAANGGFLEGLDWSSWNVAEFLGMEAQIQIVDANSGGFGYLLVDQIEFSNSARNPHQSAPTAVNLIVDGVRVATATGSDSEALDWQSWDVSQYIGLQAQIEIVDYNTGSWGHISVDQIVQSSEAAKTSAELADWVDWGADHYATISWDNLPEGSGPAVISWMSNWSYAGAVPTGAEGFRGSMTLPREYALREIDGEIRLVQRPVDALKGLRREHVGASDVALAQGNIVAPMDGLAVEIIAVFDPGDALDFGLSVRVGTSEETRIGYNVATGQVYVDRTHSGANPSDLFAAVHAAPLERMEDGTVKLHVFVDAASVELFANDGLRTITDQIFPNETSVGIELFADGGIAHLETLDVWRLSPDPSTAEDPPLDYIGTASADLLAPWSGASDVALGSDVPLRYEGGGGDDVILGSNVRDDMNGGTGNDLLIGYRGDDALDGDAGADVMRGGPGSDAYFVDDANDQVIEHAHEGNDSVSSTVSFVLPAHVERLTLAGNAAISGTGNDLTNSIKGNAASNRLDGKGGGDLMTGGKGDDVYIVDHMHDRVVEKAGEGVDTVLASVSHTLAGGAENLVLTGNAAISGTGNKLANEMTGNDADNRLDGKGGVDLMTGRNGDDVYVVDHTDDRVVEKAGEGIDTVISSVALTLPDHVENLILAKYGKAGSGKGPAAAVGNALDNVIKGNAGKNLIAGKEGNDILFGRHGADCFLFDTGLDKKTNTDRITDFERKKDKIVLDADIFAGLEIGKLGKDNFVKNGKGKAKDADDRIVCSKQSGAVFYDEDGKGGVKAVKFAVISDSPDKLAAKDFIVVA